MDIKEFYKQTYANNQNSTEHNTQSSNNVHNNQDFSQYQDTIDKYKNLSQDELYSELLSQASDLKAQGKLDTNTLNQISSTLGPMLNSEQQQLLNNIINRLK